MTIETRGTEKEGRFERLLAVSARLARAASRAEVVRVALEEGLTSIGAARGALALNGGDASGDEPLSGALHRKRPASARLTDHRVRLASPFPLEVEDGWGALAADFPEGDDGAERLLASLADLVAAALGRLAREDALVREASVQREAQEAHRFVARASERLASSLDDPTTLTVLARLAVPRLGDWCVVDMVTREGVVARAAVQCAEGEDPSLAPELLRLEPPQGSIGPASREVLASSLPCPDLPPDLVPVAERIGARSALAVYALGAADETVRIALFTGRSGRRLSYAEFGVAEELARCTSHALERAHLYAEAQRANQAKDVFLGTVSHELRGPLAAISMWTHVLGFEQCDDETRARAAEAIDESVVAQARLIDDMLDLSRAIAGTLRLETGPVVIASVLRTAIDRVRAGAEAKGIALSFESDVHATVSGDESRLLQVFGNVLANAIAFTPPGGRVEIAMARLPAGVRIEVRDNGEGISPDFLPHLFEPFRQEDVSLTRARGGLGLGLAVARQIVERHSGTIRAESAGRGEGAVFAIELPLA